jgi:hypothetical protein
MYEMAVNTVVTQAWEDADALERRLPAGEAAWPPTRAAAASYFRACSAAHRCPVWRDLYVEFAVESIDWSRPACLRDRPRAPPPWSLRRRITAGRWRAPARLHPQGS